MSETRKPALDVTGYTLLRHVQGCMGGRRTILGEKGVCRYCDRNATTFRKTAHAIPEALGNKWIFSQDECDACNGKFSAYEDALANSVSPFLTLGGTMGKRNKVRQTGRSAGDSGITRHHKGLSISTKSADPKDHVGFDPISGRFRLLIPVPGIPFRPRHAYKALSKVALALLPDDELDHYQQLRAWLSDAHDTVDFPVLDVAMSFGSIGNAPPLVAASLLRRTDPHDLVPHILFILCAGSVCLQIDLMSDHLEDRIPPTPIGCVNIAWSVVLAGGEDREPIRLNYGAPIHQNWSASETTPQPIETMVLDFDTHTCIGRWTPLFRT